MPRYARCSALFLLLAATLLHHAQAQTCTTSWIESAGGSWFDADNWDNGVPGPADDACITLSGTYTVTAGDFTVNSLTLGGSSGIQTLQTATDRVDDLNIATTGVIGANGVFEWNNAILESGTLTNQGLVRLASAGGGAVRGATTVFRNESTVEHIAGGFNISSDGRVKNASVWDVQGDVGYPGSGITGGGVFVNEVGAVFQKTAGTGTAAFSSLGRSFDNFGTIDVQSGELAIGWPSTHTDAVLTTAAGATLHFTTDAAMPSSTFIGTITGHQEGVLRMRHPFTAGANVVWNFTGTGMAWEASLTSGTLTNQGLVRTTSTGGAAVQGTTAVFRNEGTVALESFPSVTIRQDGRVENASVWDAQSDGAGIQGFGGTFVNEAGAVFKKTGGTGVTAISGTLLFDNVGTMDAHVGEMNIGCLSTHTDAMLTTSAGATLRFSSPPFGSASATFMGPITGNQAGTLVLAQDFAGGPDAVWTFTGNALLWEAGLLTSGTLTSQTPIRITEATDKGVDGATALLRTESPVVHEEGLFQIAGGARVENASVWDVQGDPVYNGATGTGTFVNEAGAVFQKTAGSGATVFTDGDLVINNAGTVSVESGEIDINQPFDHQAGALIQGTGIFDVSDATFTHSGDTGPGTSPGILTWEGTYAMGSTAVLHIEIVDDTGDGTGHDLLSVTGDADVRLGTLTVTGTPDACTSTPPCDYTILTFTGSFTGPFAQEILPPNATVIYPDDAEGVPGEVFIRAGGLLPVELISFDSVLNGETVQLRWTTASETNNAGFEIQRISKTVGADGRPAQAWQSLAFVEGHGTTVEPQRYDFSDTALPYGAAIVRYRLKQIDYDGTFDYSPEVDVALATPTAFVLTENYPNPFNPQTRIRFALPQASDVRLVVYDVRGREVTRLIDGMRPAGRHEAVFDAANLPAGLYIYRLQAGSFTQVRHMLRVK